MVRQFFFNFVPFNTLSIEAAISVNYFFDLVHCFTGSCAKATRLVKE
jgi:hypothetical protein